MWNATEARNKNNRKQSQKQMKNSKQDFKNRSQYNNLLYQKQEIKNGQKSGSESTWL